MALIEQVGEKDAIASISVAGGAVNPSTSDKQNQQLAETQVCGDQGPIQQREQPTGAAGYAEHELFTIDTNMEQLLGTQPLINNGRLKVEEIAVPEIVMAGVMQRTNDEVKIALSGMSTLTLQTQGTWAGTITFYGSVDGQNWNAINGQSLNATAYAANTSTVQSIFRFSVAGLLAFKCQFTTATSGKPLVILVASTSDLTSGTINANIQGTVPVSFANTQVATVDGSSANAILQNVNDTTNGRLIVQDNGYVKDALQYPDPWNTLTYYFTGDLVTFNGQIYRCLQYSAASAANNSPLNAANWAIDQRQYKSVVNKSDLMAPNESRLKVQLDFGQYNREITERQMIYQRLGIYNDMMYYDNHMLVSQDQGGNYGKTYGSEQDGSSHYLFEEIQ